jgi:hypothetical protein
MTFEIMYVWNVAVPKGGLVVNTHLNFGPSVHGYTAGDTLYILPLYQECTEPDGDASPVGECSPGIGKGSVPPTFNDIRYEQPLSFVER